MTLLDTGLDEGARRLRLFMLWAWKYFARCFDERRVTGLRTEACALQAARAAMARPPAGDPLVAVG